MSFELKVPKKKMKITLYDQVYEVRFPSVREVEAFDVNIEGKTGRDALAVMRMYLADLGLPETATLEMDSIDFPEVIGFINNPKKK